MKNVGRAREWPLWKGDCFIEVTVKAGLTVYTYIKHKCPHTLHTLLRVLAQLSLSDELWSRYHTACDMHISNILPSHTTYPPASSGSALPIRWAMKSVSHSMWICRSLEQHRSPSYSTAQYPFSTVQSRSPTRMLYALCTLALHSEQNLKQNKFQQIHVPSLICQWKDSSLRVQNTDRLKW